MSDEKRQLSSNTVKKLIKYILPLIIIAKSAYPMFSELIYEGPVILPIYDGENLTYIFYGILIFICFIGYFMCMAFVSIILNVIFGIYDAFKKSAEKDNIEDNDNKLRNNVYTKTEHSNNYDDDSEDYESDYKSHDYGNYDDDYYAEKYSTSSYHHNGAYNE